MIKFLLFWLILGLLAIGLAWLRVTHQKRRYEFMYLVDQWKYMDLLGKGFYLIWIYIVAPIDLIFSFSYFLSVAWNSFIDWVIKRAERKITKLYKRNSRLYVRNLLIQEMHRNKMRRFKGMIRDQAKENKKEIITEIKLVVKNESDFDVEIKALNIFKDLGYDLPFKCDKCEFRCDTLNSLEWHISECKNIKSK